MAKISVQVATDLRGVEALRDAMREFGSGVGAPIFARWRNQVASLYSAAMKRRFVQFSRGGGTWPALAESTLLGRRGASANALRRARSRSFAGNRRQRVTRTRAYRERLLRARGTAAILRDTGALFRALDVRNTGNGTKAIRGGIVFQFSDATHPKRGGKGKPMTIARLATIHHFGQGRVPRRTILVDPPEETKKLIRRSLADACQRIRDAAVRRGGVR